MPSVHLAPCVPLSGEQCPADRPEDSTAGSVLWTLGAVQGSPVCRPAVCKRQSSVGRGVYRAQEPHKQGENQNISVNSLQRASINLLPGSHVIASSFSVIASSRTCRDLKKLYEIKKAEKSPSSFYSWLCLFIAGGSSWEGRNKGSIRPECGFAEGPRWEASAPVSRVLHCSHGPDKTAEGPWEQLELWAAGTARTPEPCASRVWKVEDSKAK